MTTMKRITTKSLESLADFSSSFWTQGQAVSPTVSRRLIFRVAEASETVDGILRHMTDDIVNVPFRITGASEFKNPKPENVQKVLDFLSQPNPDDTSDEWLENFTYDLILFGDAFWEKSGTRDRSSSVGRTKKTWFGGELKAIWHIPCYTMKPISTSPTGQLPVDPSEMAYQQDTSMSYIEFNRDKIIRASRFKKDRMNGVSPLNSLFNIIAAQLNLTGYIGNLFSGEIPKSLLNVGKMTPEKFERLKLDIQEQLQLATNPYGMLAINVPENFQFQKLMDSAQEGQFLETLKYYREEICAVFGVPPSKMGYTTPGKLGSQDNMDDTYYDIIENIQRKLERVIYRGIIQPLNCPDCYLKFHSVRPKKIKLESEARARNARFFQVGRQEGIISINECRIISELPTINENWANDPRYPSPTVKVDNGDEDDAEDGDSTEPGDEQDSDDISQD